MKTRVAIIIVVVLTILLGAVCLLNRPKIHAAGRVLLKVEDKIQLTNPPYTVYAYIAGTFFNDVSNYLSSADVKAILAQGAHTTVDDFGSVQVTWVRSTWIVRFESSASESNVVWNVASNTAFLVEARYATNQLGILVEHIDTEFWQPPSVW